MSGEHSKVESVSTERKLYPNANRRVDFGCFWQSGCSDSARCLDYGSSIAAQQAGGATFAKPMKAAASSNRDRFPGTASMFASQRRLAVTEEWMRGWNACLDEIDRRGGFNDE